MKQFLGNLKRVSIYVSVNCSKEATKGTYGYVIDSEAYYSTKKTSWSQSNSERIAMRAVIDAMFEIQSQIGNGCEIHIYSEQHEVITSMIYGNCKKFEKKPNQDLVKIAVEIRYNFSVYIYSVEGNECNEISVAHHLSLDAEKLPPTIDERKIDGPKSIDLLAGL